MSLVSKPAVPHRSLAQQTRSAQAWVAALFLLPAIVLLGVFLLYPLLANFRLSFVEWNGLGNTSKDVGLQNWNQLFRDAVFLRTVLNNLTLAALSILIQLPVALVLAFMFDKAGRRSGILKVLYFLPLLMSSVAIGTVFRNLYDPNFGPINAAFKAVHLDGLAQDWLGNPALGSV